MAQQRKLTKTLRNKLSLEVSEIPTNSPEATFYDLGVPGTLLYVVEKGKEGCVFLAMNEKHWSSELTDGSPARDVWWSAGDMTFREDDPRRPADWDDSLKTSWRDFPPLDRGQTREEFIQSLVEEVRTSPVFCTGA